MASVKHLRLICSRVVVRIRKSCSAVVGSTRGGIEVFRR